MGLFSPARHYITFASGYNLAGMSVPYGEGGGTTVLWKHLDVTSYPSSLGEDSIGPWRYLSSLPSAFPWIESLFGKPGDFIVALSAYSILLSALDLAATLSKKNGERDVGSAELEWHFDVAPMFAEQDSEILTRAFAMAFRDGSVVQELADCAKVNAEAIRRVWPKWVERVAGYSRSHGIDVWLRFRHGKLAIDQLP